MSAAEPLPTVEELVQRLETTEREIVAAKSALAKAEKERLSSIAGKSTNEVAQERAQQAVDAARERLRQLEQRVLVLDEAIGAAQERGQQEQRAQKIRDADAMLTERAAMFEKLEALGVEFAETLGKIMEISPKIITTLPSRMGWTPPLFTYDGLSKGVALRLYALTNGRVRIAGVHLSPFEAKELPTLAEKGEAERASVLEQFGVQAPPIPKKTRGAAARS